MNYTETILERFLVSFCASCISILPADESSSGMEYVDLLRNPEKFTGYAGFSAQRVWNNIYKENCFKYVNIHLRPPLGGWSMFIGG